VATAVDQSVAMAFCVAVTVALPAQIAWRVYASTASLSLWTNALALNCAKVFGSGHRLRISLAPPAD
jgi:hypothetical protein